MTLAIEPQLLERTTRELLRHGLAIGDEATIPAPDTGATTGLTTDGLDRLTARAQRLADDLHRLADALDAFLDHAATMDGQVGAVLDGLLAGVLR
ncbi:MAG: hypothetical protein JWO76_2739 [Nocardioides sp.]|nr:hypothetical protein [Nocardioides sp.]